MCYFGTKNAVSYEYQMYMLVSMRIYRHINLKSHFVIQAESSSNASDADDEFECDCTLCCRHQPEAPASLPLGYEIQRGADLLDESIAVFGEERYG